MHRILYVFQEARLNGPIVRSLEIARSLDRSCFEPIFALPQDEEGDLERVFRSQSLSSYRIRLKRPRDTKDILSHLGYLAGFLQSVYQMARLIKKERIDIVYVNQLTHLHSALAAKLTGRSLIWHITALLWPQWMLRILLPIVRTLANVTVVSTQLQRNLLIDEWGWPADKVVTLYAPVDTTKFHPGGDDKSFREELQIDPANPLVVMVGNLNPIKGHRFFIQAAREILHSLPDAHFAIVGQLLANRKDYADSLHVLSTSLGIQDRIHFAGRRDNIAAILASADVFVLPSISEACPIVVLEAMSMARPIVATSVGGVPEQIRHQREGLLVESQSSNAISEAVLWCLQHQSEALSMGASARQRVQRIFDTSVVVRDHERLYKRLLSENSHEAEMV